MRAFITRASATARNRKVPQRLFAGQVPDAAWRATAVTMSNRINISKDEVDLRDPVRRTSGVWEFKTTLSN